MITETTLDEDGVEEDCAEHDDARHIQKPDGRSPLSPADIC